MPRDIIYGKTLSPTSAEAVAEELRTKQANRLDKIVSPSSLTVTHGATVNYHLTEDGVTTQQDFTLLAFDQFLGRMRIPVSFYNRCPVHLQFAMAEYWLRQLRGDLLLRCVRTGDDCYIRAVLSDRYTRLDDEHIYPVVMETLGGDITYRSFTYDEKLTQLIVTFPDQVRTWDGRTITGGLMVTNSEIGLSSVWIEPVVIYGRCHYVGRQSLHSQRVDMRIIHRGDVEPEHIAAMVNSMRDIAQVGIVQLAESWGQRITSEHAVSILREIDSLPTRMMHLLEDEWKAQADISKGEVTARIMELASSLPLFQRELINQQACKHIDIFRNHQARFRQIAQELG